MRFSAGKGDFEEGYIRGFRDANKLGTGTSGREKLDADYAGMKREWQEGYARGLADAGRDLSRSMQALLVQPSRNIGGYSAGYMQVCMLLRPVSDAKGRTLRLAELTVGIGTNRM